ncbi:D-isomer specific 2-hydroxyacid dehydrogenase [Aspergillus pseudocaelatus]|uniref:D-isomer specific 2-hydroxyacid dehydrogenase n=1 Tax=Aspergillus pseudocaelatus TaxID=1825620 RepID=A0ABQ6WN75_9EURO|nr:D-isomer specific 2-hydroxyacid dehydrogenase [Aspergillus pseudocaelatus]
MATDNNRHHIVAIEAVHCPIPSFDLAQPYSLDVYSWTNESDLASRVKDATIILTTTIRLSAGTLSPQITPKLRLIVIMASGTDCVDKPVAKARGITVCHCPGTNVDSVSEHAIGLYFATRRKLVNLNNITTTVPADRTHDTEWKMNGSIHRRLRTPDGKAPLLCCDETVGIIGYGSLGKRIEVLARGLGMNVIVAERNGATPRAGRISFEDTLRKSTVLILCLPRSPETVNLVSIEELRMMPAQAVLINVARGGIVDEGALFHALKEESISGAAVDVYANEPIGRGDSPLLSPDAANLNLVLTPHLAWFAERTLQNLQAAVKCTVERWCAGDTINQVDC